MTSPVLPILSPNEKFQRAMEIADIKSKYQNNTLKNEDFNAQAKLFLQKIQDFLFADETKKRYRTAPSYFTRKKFFTFPNLAVLLLYQRAISSSSRLSSFFEAGGFGLVPSFPTDSAFCQARQKITPEFFKAWTDQTVNYIYHEENSLNLQRWRGKLLWAVDGSDINLPVVDEIYAHCYIARNSLEKTQVPQAKGSLLFDVLNHIIINCELQDQNNEIQIAMNSQIPCLRSDVITIYDRGYVSYGLIAFHLMKGHDFIIRCPTSNSFKAIDHFIQSSQRDMIFSIPKPTHTKNKEYPSDLPQKVTVRLIKFVLPSGETEILMTSLLDSKLYPCEDFQWIYFQRWKVETVFDMLKNRLNLEHFSSEKWQGVLQDYYAAVFLYNFESILNRKTEEIIKRRGKKSNRLYSYKINKANAYTMITKRLPVLFHLTFQSIDINLSQLHTFLLRNPIPERPQRSFPRKKHKTTALSRYLKGRKRCYLT